MLVCLAINTNPDTSRNTSTNTHTDIKTDTNIVNYINPACQLLIRILTARTITQIIIVTLIIIQIIRSCPAIRIIITKKAAEI